MAYVEWLRVRRALIIIAWIFGVLFALDVVARIAMQSHLGGGTIVDQIGADPGTHRTETTLPDGTKRVSLDAPDGTHVVVDDRGYNGKTITVREPLSRVRRAETNHVGVGSFTVNERTEGHDRITTIQTNDVLPIGMLVVFGAFFGLIAATILGTPFASENDGHLEYAFTRPADRAMLALQAMLADIAGIAITIAGGTVAAFLLIVIWQLPRLQMSNPVSIANAFVVAIAWYALLCALTASMRNGHKLVAGLAIPAFLVVLGLGLGVGTHTVVGQAIHAIFHTLMYVFPMVYYTPDLGAAIDAKDAISMDIIVRDTAIATGLAVVYAALAIVQWRRVQA